MISGPKQAIVWVSAVHQVLGWWVELMVQWLIMNSDTDSLTSSFTPYTP